MRKGFTLIELMIVIAIIAINAANAIPNLLESRITSQESAAAAALKSGILPAEVQFQSGGYIDADSNGVGCYAVSGASGLSTSPYDQMCGNVTVGNGINLHLLAPSYQGSTPLISGYRFSNPACASSGVVPTSTADGVAEQTWAVLTYPTDNTSGRKAFAINQAGMIYQTKPSNTAYTTFNAVSPLHTDLFETSCQGQPASATWVPYAK